MAALPLKVEPVDFMAQMSPIATPLAGLVFNNAVLGDFMDAVPAHMAVVDRNAAIVAVNAAWRRFSADNGGKAEAFIGVNYLSVCLDGGGEAAAIGRGLKAVLAGRLQSFELEYPCPSGDRKLWFKCLISPLSDGNAKAGQGGETALAGTLQGAIVMHVDITDRVQAEEDAKERERQTRLIADNVPAMVSYVDADLVFRFVNKQYEDWWGVPAEQVLGKRLPDMLGDEVFSRIGNHVREALDGQETEFEGVARQTNRWYRARLMPDRHADGSTRGYFALIYDISKDKRQEAELTDAKRAAERANVAKSEFLANMSHELRTPLNAVIGFSEMLITEIFGPLGHERYGEYAKDIHNSGQHLLSVIDDILDLSKVEAGRYELHEEDIDVTDVLIAATHMVAGRAAKGGVALDTDIAADLPKLRGDERLLRQVLLNLLSNAVKFTPPGGRVTAAARLDERGLTVAVSDTGVGIAAEDIPKVLEPFGQAASDMQGKEKGTGLGLPLTKSFIELHGGAMSLTSILGQGTTVTAAFPIARVLA